MRSAIARLIILFCILIQAVEAPWTFADSLKGEAKTVKIGGHELTMREVIVGGVVAHLIIDRSLDGLVHAYFEIQEEDFENAAAKLMPKNPKKVLYITSYDSNGELYRRSKLRFDQRYGNHPNYLFLNVTSPEELFSELKALPQDSSFDLIEIDMHGNRGVLGFADGTALLRHDHPWHYRPRKHLDVEELNHAGLKIAAPGAILRVRSCYIADDLKPGQPIGKDFLKDFGKSFLPNGGRVVASEKRTVNLGFKAKVFRKIPVVSEWEQIKDLVGNLIREQIPKGFRFRKDIVQIDIPPREPSCAPAVMQALQRALKD